MKDNKLVTVIEKIVPRYGILPVILVFAYNIVTYYGTRIFNLGFDFHDVSIGLDGEIPLFTPFVLIYVLAFCEWVFGYVMIARESHDLCYQIISAEIIAKTICLIIFILYPTTMIRPEITGTDIFDWILGFIYSVDIPTNLLPSIHVLESYLIARASLSMSKVSKGYKIFVWAFFVLVAMSVLLVKQHVVLDIIAALIVAELGIFLSKGLKLGKKHEEYLEKKR